MPVTNGQRSVSDATSVLIVDDSPDKLIALESILLELSVRIVKARSGREALRRLLGEDFAVILLDVRMPDMDGFETAALVRKRPRSEFTPIIFITAFADEMHVTRGYSLNAVDYIVTPVVPEILRTKVSVFVDLFRAAGEVKRQAECLEHRAAQLHRLTTASLAINAAASVDEMLAVAVDSGRDLLGANYAVATAVVDDRRSHRAVSGRVPPTDDGRGAPHTACAALGARDGRRLGVIEVGGLPDDYLGPQDRDLLVQLAQITSIAIENTLYGEVREANRLKDEFLATVSHELRTPLSAMLSWVAVLRRSGADPATTARALEAIDRNVRAQAHIVDDLLDVSRIVAGKLRLNVRRSDLRSVIEMAADSASAASAAKGIELTTHVDPEVGPFFGDPDRLQQVVWNLLSNAIKFTPRGGRVAVRLGRAGDDVEMSVIDSGAGIPATFLPHVFEPFRQADGSTSRTSAGLGLGLAIVRRLVELHGGRVEARSDGEGRGATFVVTLPNRTYEETAAPEPDVRPVVEPPDSAGPRRIDGLRVLAVEDDPDSRDALRVLLAEAGAVVVAVGTAGEAMAALRTAVPDVLLCDIGLPGEDGYTFLGRVRALPVQQGGATPAVALTAYAQAADRERALEAGFRVHLAKPVDPRQLLHALAESAVEGARGGAGSAGVAWAASASDPEAKVEGGPAS